jgi:hypothetical protein
MSVLPSVLPPILLASSSMASDACVLGGESLLFLIRALAICKMRARRELRSPVVPELSDQTEGAETAEPENSDPDSHVPALASSLGGEWAASSKLLSARSSGPGRRLGPLK